MTLPLEGRGAIITGASQGLGFAVAEAFVDAGADILVCARTVPDLKKATARLTSKAGNAQKVVSVTADVSKEEDVQRLAKVASEKLSGLHILVNNAGVYGPKGNIEDIDWAEWTQAIEINLYGSILMCRAVLPVLKKQQYGKIIQISGGGATSPLPRISAYAASKAGIVRFAETLAEEVRGTGIDVNAIAPGALNTRLLDEVLDSGPEGVGDNFFQNAIKQKKQGGTPPELGAKLAVFLASAESDGITGKLISAKWDPWEDFPKYADAMNGNDIYTLRRIVPSDRGQDWGEQ